MFSEKQTKNETIIYFIVIANKNFELRDIIMLKYVCVYFEDVVELWRIEGVTNILLYV